MFDDGRVSEWLALAPQRVWRGEVWRLVTWAFVQLAPWNLILSCAVIYKFGGDLAPRWGDRRLSRFVFQIVVAGGVIACIGALVSERAWEMARYAGWAVEDALVIAWARQFPHSTVRFFGFFELGGQRVVWLVVGWTTLWALAASPFVLAPELVACALTAGYARAWLARL